ncbi:MAG TPA: helix-turn-helix transcriptional regulator [Bauldia sp.]|nr:helix-turn-helix transcriptional regulator [Bauldia sp.]
MDDELVDLIYEAAAAPGLWLSVLEKLGQTVGSPGATLIVPGLGRWLATPSIEETVAELVSSGLISTNERTRGLVAFDHPGFVTDQDIFPLEQIPSIPAYRDFFIPRGGGLGVGTIIPSPTGDAMIFHVERPIAEGPVPRAAVDTLDGLRPHLARASLLSTRLEFERVTAAAAALELMGLPGAVLGSGGRVMFTNRLLEGLMPTVIQDRRARIAISDPNADRLLEQALAHLTGGQAPPFSIPVPAREGDPPMIVHLMPIRGSAHDVFTSATAIVVVTPVVPRDVPSAEVVQGLFDLTPAEARVAREIGRGKTVNDIAASSNVSVATVRTHVKSVLYKTGLHRQSELTGLLRGLPQLQSKPD